MKKQSFFVILFLALFATESFSQKSNKVIKTLIVDGQNNHVQWPKITVMMKQILEETGRFKVDVNRSKYT